MESFTEYVSHMHFSFNWVTLCIAIGVITAIIVKLHTTNNHSELKDKFIKREQEARFAENKSIPDNLFLFPSKNLPLDKLDITERKYKRLYNELSNYPNLSLVKVPNGMTNTDLKELYGPNTLIDIIIYEQNYNKYIHLLNELAKMLIDDDKKQLASVFLQEAINLSSEVSKTYIYMLDVYSDDRAKRDNFFNDFINSHDENNFYVKRVIAYKELHYA